VSAATLLIGVAAGRDVFLTLGLYALSGTIMYAGLAAGCLRIAGVPLSQAARHVLRHSALAGAGALPVALVKFVLHWNQPMIVAACGLVLGVFAMVIMNWIGLSELRAYIKPASPR
jgi:hypothetical protein